MHILAVSLSHQLKLPTVRVPSFYTAKLLPSLVPISERQRSEYLSSVEMVGRTNQCNVLAGCILQSNHGLRLDTLCVHVGTSFNYLNHWSAKCCRRERYSITCNTYWIIPLNKILKHIFFPYVRTLLYS